MKTFALAMILGAATATPAMAQSADEKPTFTGPHAGVSVGWNRGSDKGVLAGTGKKVERESGVAVRGNVGYDAPLGTSAIVGAELGIGSGGRDIRTTVGATRYTTDPRLTLDATARLGFKPSDNLLIFGKAGWAYQRVQTTLDTGTTRFSRRDGEHGFLWGVGTEVALSPKVALRADFDRVSFNEHYKRNRLIAGVNFRL